MMWDKEALHSDFDKNIEALKEYVDTYGNALVPKDYAAESGIALGRWIMMFRMKCNSGKLEKTITQEQKAMLDDLGMVWNVNDYYWDQMYQDAKKYYEEHGHLYSIPKTLMTENGTSLCTWLNRQKAKYHHTAGTATLSEDQIKKLGSLWDYTDYYWERMYETAKAYYEYNGHLNVTSSYISSNGAKLGLWISDMRKRYKNAENSTTIIRNDQIERLEEIGMRW